MFRSSHHEDFGGRGRRQFHQSTARRGSSFSGQGGGQGRRHRGWRRKYRPYPHQPHRGMDGDRTPRRRRGEDLEDWEVRRAKWLKKHQVPDAPYNSNQFLLDDHKIQEPDFEEISKSLLNSEHHHHGHHSQGGSQQGRKVVLSGSLDEGADQLKPKMRRRCHSESTPSMSNDTLTAIPSAARDDSSSDEYYSSPDDEQDFMQRQFSETYDNIHAERLNSMTKNELVQDYLQLERRVEELESKLSEERVNHNPQTGQCTLASAAGGGVCGTVGAGTGVSGGLCSGGYGTVYEPEVIERIRSESESTEDRVEQLQVEMKRLQSENQRLSLKNQQMRCMIADQELTRNDQRRMEVDDGHKEPEVKHDDVLGTK